MMVSHHPKPTADQKAAIEAIGEGRNVFLTGEGGTGKSFTIGRAIEALRAAKRSVLVCAPTGVAALNVGGSTIHRTFGLPPKPLVDKRDFGTVPKAVHATDTLIIDEAGMMRLDMMDAVNRILDIENARRAKDGKLGPIQVVVVGDFFQLPPVVTDKDREVLETAYERDVDGGCHAFQAPSWESRSFETHLLRDPIRQRDPELVANLNLARVGNPACLPYFNDHVRKPEADAVNLCATNAMAERINRRMIDRLGSAKTYWAESSGEVSKGDQPVPHELVLAVGARVIMAANDPGGRWVNGSMGEVIELGENSVWVAFDNGGEAEARPYDWKVTRYVASVAENGETKLGETVIGTYTQLPLKPAWAITIHKSQGQTLDKVAVDPVPARGYDVTPGLLYVALSRCTSPRGLCITQRIEPDWLVADEQVARFYASLKSIGPKSSPKPRIEPLDNQAERGSNDETGIGTQYGNLCNESFAKFAGEAEAWLAAHGPRAGQPITASKG